MATKRCNKKYFIAGGRVERTCGESAEFVCAECGKARCEQHGDESFEEVDGRLYREDCVPDNNDNRMPYSILRDDRGVTLICACGHVEPVADGDKSVGSARTAAAGRMMVHIRESHGQLPRAGRPAAAQF